VWQVQLLLDQFFRMMVGVNKNDAHLQKPFHYCFALPLQTQPQKTKCSSGRHKRSSGRSISKAAPHFGNLYTNPVLFRRSLPLLGRNLPTRRRSLQVCGRSLLICSAAAALQIQFRKAFQMSASIFLMRTIDGALIQQSVQHSSSCHLRYVVVNTKLIACNE